MAWFQDLAGKAEDLLNKIDKNAANVFDTSAQSKQPPNELLPYSISEGNISGLNVEVETTLPRSNSSDNVHSSALATATESLESIGTGSTILLPSFSDGTVSDVGSDDTVQPEPAGEEPQVVSIFEHPGTMDSSESSSSTASVQNIMFEDIKKYQHKVHALETHIQDLNKQLLNLQHSYNEVKNDNSQLSGQLDRTNHSLTITQTELEQYKFRAQKVLQEKDKLLALKQGVETSDKRDTAEMCNEELREELRKQEERNCELDEKVENLTRELNNLQSRFVNMQLGYQQAVNSIQKTLTGERTSHNDAKDELKVKLKEIERLRQENVHQRNTLNAKTQELQNTKERLKQISAPRNVEELEKRLNSLSDLLMKNQTTLETVTTERNAYRLQMEKLEADYSNVLCRLSAVPTAANVVNISDDEDNEPSQFTYVTRRFRRAYTAVDAASSRTGQFLRRYPIARSFFFVYILFLHLWVVIILANYIPSL